MLQDIYIALVECECGHRFPMVYEYPSRRTYPFAEPCSCNGSQLFIVSDTAPTPEQWFEQMEAKRGRTND